MFGPEVTGGLELQHLGLAARNRDKNRKRNARRKALGLANAASRAVGCDGLDGGGPRGEPETARETEREDTGRAAQRQENNHKRNVRRKCPQPAKGAARSEGRDCRDLGDELGTADEGQPSAEMKDADNALGEGGQGSERGVVAGAGGEGQSRVLVKGRQGKGGAGRGQANGGRDQPRGRRGTWGRKLGAQMVGTLVTSRKQVSCTSSPQPFPNC
jgi:hypothetical protein